MRLDNICKSYGEKAVLKDFSAVFANGGFSWIMGESGCGKTTLLRIIAGLRTFRAAFHKCHQAASPWCFRRTGSSER